MRCKLMYYGLATVWVLFCGVATSAAHEVTIGSTATLGAGPTIEPGAYRVEVVRGQESSHAVFYKGSDEVARAPVTLVAEDSKPRQTEIHSRIVDGRRLITQIRLQGAKEKLVFEKIADEPTQSQ